MMLLAMIWVTIAPVALLVPMWLVFRGLGALNLPVKLLPQRVAPRLRVLRAGLAVVLVLAPVLLIWQTEHRAFVRVCQQQGMPVITRTAQADGFFLDDGTANSFGMRYLQTEGFQWMEARSIYQRDAYVRYSRAADGKIIETPQATRSARYVVLGESSQPHAHTHVRHTRILDTEAPIDAQEIAHAAMVYFDGGRLKWLLGIYGGDSFPSALSDPATWRKAYDLVDNTLKPASIGKKTR